MKRWQEDVTVMKKRWKEEIESHRDETFGNIESNCHCLRGMGTMRKRRPYDRCSPNQHCGICEMERYEQRLKRRRIRQEGKEICRNIVV